MHNNVRKQLTKSPFNEQKDLLAQRYAVDPLSRKIRIRKSYHPIAYYLLGPTYLPTYLPFQSYIHVPTTIPPTNTR